MNYIQSEHFPLTQNGSMFPFIKRTVFNDACYEVANHDQVPIDLVIPTALSSAAIAFSHDVEVEYPLGDSEPLILFFTVLAGSGTGKTRAHKRFFKPINKFLKHMSILQGEYEKEYYAELMCWQDMLNQIRKSTVDPESKKVQLYLHEINKPIPPYNWDIVIEDSSPLGALEKAQGMRSIAITSSEGMNFFNAKTLDSIEKFCAAWSNEPIKVTRKTYNIEVSDTDIHIFTPVQPQSFLKLLESKGDKLRSSGYFARTLFAFIGENRGNAYQENHKRPEFRHLEKFEARVTVGLDRLKQNIQTGQLQKRQLRFSPQALQKWFQVHNEIQFQTNPSTPNGRFHGCTDHAARLMQNITRVAGVLHCINADSYEDEIDLDTLQESINMVAYFSDTYRWLFVKPPQAILDAQLLDGWLNLYRKNCPNSFIRKNFILQNGPNSLRGKDRLNNALYILQQNNLITMFSEDKTTWINLIPNIQPSILPEALKDSPKAHTVISSLQN
ncbi:MAG: DUF3987 domain-containing protein [Thiotrichales bacterium]|nr:DUF3987 domain-containing protein [Thiotrichales bacterium]